MSQEIIRQFAADCGLSLDEVIPISRRADPLDKAAGAHIPDQGDINLYVDLANASVYKLGPAEKLPKYQTDYLASQLALEHNLSVTPPLAQPRVYGHLAIYATRYIPHKYDDSADPAATGQLLARLHQVETQKRLPVATSRLKQLAEAVLGLDDTTIVIKRAIEQRCLPLVEKVSDHMDQHDRLLHGDLHLGNVLPTYPNPTLTDFEDSGRGSPLWDLAVLVQSATRFGLDRGWARTCLDNWKETIGQNIADGQLEEYVDWRYWYGVLSMIKRVDQGRGNKRELGIRLRWLLDPTDRSKWTRC